MVYAEAEIGIDYLLYSLQIIIGEVLVFVELFSVPRSVYVEPSYVRSFQSHPAKSKLHYR